MPMYGVREVAERMNNSGETAARRLSFMTPLLLLVLFFVLCCGVLSCVFIRSAAISREAEIYNASVTLCRSEAERFRANAAAEGEQLCFDADFSPCAAEESVYTLRVERTAAETPAGTLETAVLSAGATGAEPVYSLTVTAYRPPED